MSWGRALARGVVIAVVGVGLLAYVPNIIVTRWTALTHPARIALATAFFFVALAAIAIALRYLQKRDLL